MGFSMGFYGIYHLSIFSWIAWGVPVWVDVFNRTSWDDQDWQNSQASAVPTLRSWHAEAMDSTLLNSISLHFECVQASTFRDTSASSGPWQMVLWIILKLVIFASLCEITKGNWSAKMSCLPKHIEVKPQEWKSSGSRHWCAMITWSCLKIGFPSIIIQNPHWTSHSRTSPVLVKPM
jgi:hypothetical protein